MRYTFSVAYLSPKEIKELNIKYRNKDYVPAVLSFPINDLLESGETYLGEVIICLEKCGELARDNGTTKEAEAEKLILHGLSNLLKSYEGWGC